MRPETPRQAEWRLSCDSTVLGLSAKDNHWGELVGYYLVVWKFVAEDVGQEEDCFRGCFVFWVGDVG